MNIGFWGRNSYFGEWLYADLNWSIHVHIKGVTSVNQSMVDVYTHSDEYGYKYPSLHTSAMQPNKCHKRLGMIIVLVAQVIKILLSLWEDCCKLGRLVTELCT